MSEGGIGYAQGFGAQTIVPVYPLWNWSTPVSGVAQTVLSYPTTNGPTKSGIMPMDLRAYMQIPIQQFGNPPTPVSDMTLQQWIRYAEDDIEQDTNIRLCQTWIAAPPATSQASTQALNIGVKYNYQQLGVDYDYAEAGYDFFFKRARDEGWLFQKLRWRPVKGVDYVDPTGIINATNYAGVKNMAFIYPLLNEYFRMPQSWVVEDQNHGYVRFVPATNVQMLPLFAMQLAFMGFAESVPSGLWFQYTAGLTPNDYNSSWSFMRQLVLAKAALITLGNTQLSVNYGATETMTQVDGLSYRVKWNPNGAFAGPIKFYEDQVKQLSKTAKSRVRGPVVGFV